MHAKARLGGAITLNLKHPYELVNGSALRHLSKVHYTLAGKVKDLTGNALETAYSCATGGSYDTLSTQYNV